MKIGVQGDEGSFSESAGIEFAKRKNIKHVKIIYLISSDNVIKNVEAGEIDYGITAIENSIDGVVKETLYALAKYRCQIDTLFHIPIKQNLMAAHGVTADEITEIYSHGQALRQCQNYLTAYFPKVKQIEYADTAKAARELSTGGLPPKAAVIGNERCAKLYHLNLLQEQINDSAENLTQFLALTSLQGLCPEGK